MKNSPSRCTGTGRTNRNVTGGRKDVRLGRRKQMIFKTAKEEADGY